MKDHPIMHSIDKFRHAILGDTDPGSNRELERQRTIAIGICLIGTVALVAFRRRGLVAARTSPSPRPMSSWRSSCSASCGICAARPRTGREPSAMASPSPGPCSSIFLPTGGASGTGYVWYYVFPLVACALLGSARGIRATAFLLGSHCCPVAMRGVLPTVHHYSGAFMARFWDL